MIRPGFLSTADRIELEACVRRQREDHGLNLWTHPRRVGDQVCGDCRPCAVLGWYATRISSRIALYQILSGFFTQTARADQTTEAKQQKRATGRQRYGCNGTHVGGIAQNVRPKLFRAAP